MPLTIRPSISAPMSGTRGSMERALGTVAPTVWTPAAAYGASDIVLHLHARDAVVGPVSSWVSRDGSAQTWTATTTARPTGDLLGLDGKYPAVVADGVANAMTRAATTGLPTSNSPSVIMVLAKGNSPANGARLFEYGVSTALQNRRIISAAAAPGNVQITNGTTSIGLSPLRAWDTPVIVVGSWATDLTEVIRIDGGGPGIDKQRSTTMTSLATATTRARIFAATATTASGFGAYALLELIGIAGSIATKLALIQMVEGFWAGKYPLLNLAAAFPADHPYKYGPP